MFKLDDSTDADGDTINDDIVSNWSFKGINTPLSESFSVIPTIAVDYNQSIPIYEFENAIRETHINHVSDANGTNTPNIFLGHPSANYEFNIVLQPAIVASLLTGHNAVPANNLVINSTQGFFTLLNDSNI